MDDEDHEGWFHQHQLTSSCLFDFLYSLHGGPLDVQCRLKGTQAHFVLFEPCSWHKCCGHLCQSKLSASGSVHIDIKAGLRCVISMLSLQVNGTFLGRRLHPRRTGGYHGEICRIHSSKTQQQQISTERNVFFLKKQKKTSWLQSMHCNEKRVSKLSIWAEPGTLQVPK